MKYRHSKSGKEYVIVSEEAKYTYKLEMGDAFMCLAIDVDTHAVLPVFVRDGKCVILSPMLSVSKTFVVYMALYLEHGENEPRTWIRDRREFHDHVLIGGKQVPRFAEVVKPSVERIIKYLRDSGMSAELQQDGTYTVFYDDMPIEGFNADELYRMWKESKRA